LIKASPPVQDTMAMEEDERERYFGGVETSTRLAELSCSLYLKHKVTSSEVLHHKEQTILNSTDNIIYLLS